MSNFIQNGGFKRNSCCKNRDANYAKSEQRNAHIFGTEKKENHSKNVHLSFGFIASLGPHSKVAANLWE